MNIAKLSSSFKIFSTMMGWWRMLGIYAQLAILSPILVFGIFPLIPIEVWLLFGVRTSPELYSENNSGVKCAFEILLLLGCFIPLSEVYHYAVREPRMFLDEINKTSSSEVSESESKKMEKILKIAEKKLRNAPFLAYWATPVHAGLRGYLGYNKKK
ncbi:hypothetical protein H6784_04755 [Candidatus Nomurabacteria bacterium]|nr:hypothetical protein [Candidatus Kaiserbacteria bacterium]MCB9814699.1 hypothetical protein [Candidatus Nomurabacteria bacterium]